MSEIEKTLAEVDARHEYIIGLAAGVICSCLYTPPRRPELGKSQQEWHREHVRAEQAKALAALTKCRCAPCPGRGTDGHGMTHCAECCFGSGIEAQPDCPTHGLAALVPVKPSREDVAREIASRWWDLNSGETETWEELDADERETVVENSDAEELADAVLALMPGRSEAEIKAAALREAGVNFATEAASAWGGDSTWVTTGNRVAMVAADWCDELADEIERGDA